MDTTVGRQAVLLLLLLLLSLIAKIAMSQLCSVQEEEMLMRRRLQGLRAHILAQLGMTEPPPRMNITTPKPEILEAYKALTEATDSIERKKEKTCQSEEFYAQPINSFVGTMTPVPVNYDG